MADRCLFLDDLLRWRDAAAREYELHASPRGALTCIDARARRGADWGFARRWIATDAGPRALFRLIDLLEAHGYRFRLRSVEPGSPTRREAHAMLEGVEDPLLRASQAQAGLTEDERRLHAELFPQEADLLARGYDWDASRVYRDGVALEPDEHGRFLDVDEGVLHEWIRVADELAWRRYPLRRVAAWAPSTTPARSGGSIRR